MALYFFFITFVSFCMRFECNETDGAIAHCERNYFSHSKQLSGNCVCVCVIVIAFIVLLSYISFEIKTHVDS